jgi:hypothetical protein
VGWWYFSREGEAIVVIISGHYIFMRPVTGRYFNTLSKPAKNPREHIERTVSKLAKDRREQTERNSF